jgi:hypothetical protein
MSPIDTLKKIIDVEDRTTRHEMLRRWLSANVTYVSVSQPVLGIKKVPISQRDEIVESLAHQLAAEMLERNYLTITNDNNHFHAVATFLKRLV